MPMIRVNHTHGITELLGCESSIFQAQMLTPSAFMQLKALSVFHYRIVQLLQAKHKLYLRRGSPSLSPTPCQTQGNLIHKITCWKT